MRERKGIRPPQFVSIDQAQRDTIETIASRIAAAKNLNGR